MGGAAGFHHDRALLDALEQESPEPFAGTVWRVVRQGRDPLRGSTAMGRWSPGGDLDVINTSLIAAGALAGVGYRLSLEPVWPSRAAHELHQIDVRTSRTLWLRDLGSLARFGVDIARYRTFDYSATNALAAAAHFLSYDSIVAPSARYQCLNLVLFGEHLADGIEAVVAHSDAVDWSTWEKPVL